MKNMKLLLATTAILSMGAMAVNAVVPTGAIYTEISNSADIHADVTFVRSVSISEVNHLNFGTLLNPRSGQSVIIRSSSDAPELSSGATLAFTSGTNAPHRGKLVITANPTRYPLTTTEGYHYDLVFGDSSIDLVNGDDTCGQVTDLNFGAGQGAIPDEYIYYGGTFTVDSSMNANSTFEGKCTGSTTATLVLVDNIVPSGN